MSRVPGRVRSEEGSWEPLMQRAESLRSAKKKKNWKLKVIESKKARRQSKQEYS